MNHKFIFVCGLHRSGTSILSRTLREHPQISGFQNTLSPEDEGMHLQTVFEPSGIYGGAGEFGFYTKAHLTETSHLVTEENRNKLYREWSQYWDLDKPFLLEKSPPNLIRTRFLKTIFPNSYFIILLRHPIAVTYATYAWYKKYRIYWRKFSRILEHWIVCHEILLKDNQHLDRVLFLKYEKFVSNPVLWMGRIYDFLDLDYHEITQEITPNLNNKYFSRWKNDQQRRFFKKLKNSDLSDLEVRIEKFGYSLFNLEKAAPFEPIR